MPDLKTNLTTFMANNRARIRLLQSCSTPATRTVFQYVPFLLQVNDPELPGYLPGDRVPRGLHGFVQSPYYQMAFKAMAKRASWFSQAVMVQNPVILSLLLMGSVGTVGQTKASDLDYWVCLARGALHPGQLAPLRKKLASISAWSQSRYGVETNFYLIEIEDIQENKLKPQGHEAEGEVAPLLVKEEFYRTGLYVAGRLPLWWVLPAELRGDECSRYVAGLKEQGDWSWSSVEYIDLGEPRMPDPREFLAAALWLSQKSEADPFKATLKMLVILELVESGFQAPLLCELVKSMVFSTRMEELPVDPYALMIERVLEYGQRVLDDNNLELLRISAYFKVRGVMEAATLEGQDGKQVFLRKLTDQWGWEQTRRVQLDNYLSWSHAERMELGHRLRAMLLDMYMRIAKMLQINHSLESDLGDESLLQLKANMLARYSDHEAKVPDLPSAWQRQTIPKTMTLFFNNGYWELYGQSLESWQLGSEAGESSLIMCFSRAARAAAWLVHNRLYDQDLKLKLQPRPGPVSLEAMLALLETMKTVLAPPSRGTLGETASWSGGGIGSRLLVVNLEEHWGASRLMSVDLVYRTLWGEMRHTTHDFSGEDREAGKLNALALVLQASGDVEPNALDYFVAPGPQAQKLIRNIKTVLAMALGGSRRRATTQGGSRDGSRLDRD